MSDTQHHETILAEHTQRDIGQSASDSEIEAEGRQLLERINRDITALDARADRLLYALTR